MHARFKIKRLLIVCLGICVVDSVGSALYLRRLRSSVDSQLLQKWTLAELNSKLLVLLHSLTSHQTVFVAYDRGKALGEIIDEQFLWPSGHQNLKK